jgi:hypothetical protein
MTEQWQLHRQELEEMRWVAILFQPVFVSL